MPYPFARVGRYSAQIAILVVLVAILVACSADDGAPPQPTNDAPTVTREPASSSEPSPPTTSLPADCSRAYSSQTIERLQAEDLPLNDPGVTLSSTQQAPLLEILSDAVTLRCTWGRPGPVGVSTNVTLVNAEQAQRILSDLAAGGFGCEDQGGASYCRTEQRGISLTDEEYVRGETHIVKDDLWIATAWVNVDTDGYAEDILATVQG